MPEYVNQEIESISYAVCSDFVYNIKNNGHI